MAARFRDLKDVSCFFGLRPRIVPGFGARIIAWQILFCRRQKTDVLFKFLQKIIKVATCLPRLYILQ